MRSISLEFSRVRDALNRALERQFVVEGLGKTIKVGMGPVLFYLEPRESVNPSEIASALGIPRSTVTSLRMQLEQRELVRVEPDPDDGRARPLGHGLVRRARPRPTNAGVPFLRDDSVD